MAVYSPMPKAIETWLAGEQAAAVPAEHRRPDTFAGTAYATCFAAGWEMAIARVMRPLMHMLAENERPCRLCGVHMYMIRHPTTTMLMPFSQAGVPHQADCPHYRRGRREKRTPNHQENDDATR